MRSASPSASPAATARPTSALSDHLLDMTPVHAYIASNPPKTPAACLTTSEKKYAALVPLVAEMTLHQQIVGPIAAWLGFKEATFAKPHTDIVGLILDALDAAYKSHRESLARNYIYEFLRTYGTLSAPTQSDIRLHFRKSDFRLIYDHRYQDAEPFEEAMHHVVHGGAVDTVARQSMWNFLMTNSWPGDTDAVKTGILQQLRDHVETNKLTMALGTNVVEHRGEERGVGINLLRQNTDVSVVNEQTLYHEGESIAGIKREHLPGFRPSKGPKLIRLEDKCNEITKMNNLHGHGNSANDTSLLLSATDQLLEDLVCLIYYALRKLTEPTWEFFCLDTGTTSQDDNAVQIQTAIPEEDWVTSQWRKSLRKIHAAKSSHVTRCITIDYFDDGGIHQDTKFAQSGNAKHLYTLLKKTQENGIALRRELGINQDTRDGATTGNPPTPSCVKKYSKGVNAIVQLVLECADDLKPAVHTPIVINSFQVKKATVMMRIVTSGRQTTTQQAYINTYEDICRYNRIVTWKSSKYVNLNYHDEIVTELQMIAGQLTRFLYGEDDVVPKTYHLPKWGMTNGRIEDANAQAARQYAVRDMRAQLPIAMAVALETMPDAVERETMRRTNGSVYFYHCDTPMVLSVYKLYDKQQITVLKNLVKALQKYEETGMVQYATYVETADYITNHLTHPPIPYDMLDFFNAQFMPVATRLKIIHAHFLAQFCLGISTITQIKGQLARFYATSSLTPRELAIFHDFDADINAHESYVKLLKAVACTIAEYQETTDAPKFVVDKRFDWTQFASFKKYAKKHGTDKIKNCVRQLKQPVPRIRGLHTAEWQNYDEYVDAALSDKTFDAHLLIDRDQTVHKLEEITEELSRLPTTPQAEATMNELTTKHAELQKTYERHESELRLRNAPALKQPTTRYIQAPGNATGLYRAFVILPSIIQPFVALHQKCQHAIADENSGDIATYRQELQRKLATYAVEPEIETLATMRLHNRQADHYRPRFVNRAEFLASKYARDCLTGGPGGSDIACGPMTISALKRRRYQDPPQRPAKLPKLATPPMDTTTPALPPLDSHAKKLPVHLRRCVEWDKTTKTWQALPHGYIQIDAAGKVLTILDALTRGTRALTYMLPLTDRKKIGTPQSPRFSPFTGQFT